MLFEKEYDLELVKVHEVEPPYKGFKAVTVTVGGFPTILINNRLCPQKRRSALEHEYRHILRMDTIRDTNGDDVQKIESECHAKDDEES